MQQEDRLGTTGSTIVWIKQGRWEGFPRYYRGKGEVCLEAAWAKGRFS